jgi:protoheme IX farnesyltransferase
MNTLRQNVNATKPALALVREVLSVFKLRIGFMIMLTALVGLAIVPGPRIELWKVFTLALTVFVASASAGAFNQYYEFESDRLMARTCGRAFATGSLPHSRLWLALIALLLVGAVTAAAVFLNLLAAFFVFLGAFFYAVVYTVWLKRRSAWNIVVGGLAGSFAVLAGAATVDPVIGPLPCLLATVLFLWTPPHFWSLAIAHQAQYAAAGVPMLPVVVGIPRAAQIVWLSTVALTLMALMPGFFGAGPLYMAGALLGGGYFAWRSYQLSQAPSHQTAMKAFFASLVQLGLLLLAVSMDRLWSYSNYAS